MSSVRETVAARDLDSEIRALAPWFHNLHLPDGTQTAPDHLLGDFPAFKWSEIAPHVPRDLHGWSVLDIGCNAGYYTFELASRGAHVTAIDIDPHYLAQARWAAREFGLQDCIDFRQQAVYELIGDDEQYDLIWFMGVLYHLRHPLLALDIVRRRARRFLVLQTMMVPGGEVASVPDDMSLEDRGRMRDPGWPAMAFIEKRLRGDPTNWWAPNFSGVEALLRASGFRVRENIGHETYLCEIREQDATEARMIDTELIAATRR
jgi:tRNA (mo5U34)-methyltransferase